MYFQAAFCILKGSLKTNLSHKNRLAEHQAVLFFQISGCLSHAQRQPENHLAHIFRLPLPDFL